MYLRKLEPLATRHFLAATAVFVLVAWTLFAVSVAALGYSVDSAGRVVDALLKAAAFVVAGMWAMNRYFTQRTDILQLRVDPSVDFVSENTEESEYVMLCRLDAVNTGKSLTSAYDAAIQVERPTPGVDPISYVPISRWPAKDFHRSAPIEPGSWGAISMAIRVPKATKFVRVYLELRFERGGAWTWHRHFAVREASK